MITVLNGRRTNYCPVRKRRGREENDAFFHFLSLGAIIDLFLERRWRDPDRRRFQRTFSPLYSPLTIRVFLKRDVGGEEHGTFKLGNQGNAPEKRSGDFVSYSLFLGKRFLRHGSVRSTVSLQGQRVRILAARNRSRFFSRIGWCRMCGGRKFLVHLNFNIAIFGRGRTSV